MLGWTSEPPIFWEEIKLANNKQDLSDYTKCVFCQIEFRSNSLCNKPQNVYLIFRYNILFAYPDIQKDIQKYYPNF